MTRILLIDDDSQLVALLSEYLARDGFSVASARDGVAGTAEALSGNYAIVILDPGRAELGAWRRPAKGAHVRAPTATVVTAIRAGWGAARLASGNVSSRAAARLRGRIETR